MMKFVGKILIIFISVAIFIGSALFYYHGKFGSHFFLLQSTYDKLPGWSQDNQTEALHAFKQSCHAIMQLDPKKPFSDSLPSSGNVGRWQAICQAANKLIKID